MKKFSCIALFGWLLLLYSCAVTPPPQPIDGNQLRKIADLDEDGRFAVGQDGQRLAFANKGLHLLELSAKDSRRLSNADATALAWNPQATFLAAAFPVSAYLTRLILYSAQGQQEHEVLLPVALSQMVWSSRGDLLLAGYRLEVYSFGGNLRQLLYRVDGQKVEETLLADTTLRPSLTAKVATLIGDLQPVAFSPAADELVFAELHDPPEFAPYLELHYMNWTSGGRRKLDRLPLQPLQLALSRESAKLTVVSGDGSRSLPLWPSQLSSSGYLSAGDYLSIGGRLFDGDTLLADWGPSARLQIYSGGRFLLANSGALYLGRGLKGGDLEPYRENNWNLRRWRFEGLITPDEYLKLARKVE